jgi:hypothetical protein
MVDVASIVVAVIGLFSGLVAAAFTGWVAYYSEERKRLIDAQKLVDKYSDPILLASQDLQDRLRNILLTPALIHTGLWSKRARMRTAAPKPQSDDSSSQSSLDVHVVLERPAQSLGWHPPTHSRRRRRRNPRSRTPASENQAGENQAGQNQANQELAENENLLLYTAFLVGQYFSWTFILRRQAQFLKFSIDDKNKKLAKTFQEIIKAFSLDDDPPNPLSEPFSLWRSQQGAIGELMTTNYVDEPVCIGYATFYRNWVCNRYGDSGDEATFPRNRGRNRYEDSSDNLNDMTTYEYCSGPFRQFFRPIIEGIIKVETAKSNGDERIPDQRLRRLQHLFTDLINVLDDKHVRFEEKSTKYCHRADICPCEKCSGNKTCPCSTCLAAMNREVKKQQVGYKKVNQQPIYNQTRDLEAAHGHGEQQIEIHSGDLEAGKLQVQQQAGVNRLGDLVATKSLGQQQTDDLDITIQEANLPKIYGW